jgi:hypothetical protein
MNLNGPLAPTAMRKGKKKASGAKVLRKTEASENLPVKKRKVAGNTVRKVLRKKIPPEKHKPDGLVANSDTLETAVDMSIDDEITPTITVAHRRRCSSSSSNIRVADTMEDEFIGKLVAFNCNTDYGQELITSFGHKFTLEAVCTELNRDFGHIIGVVLRKSKMSGRRGITPDCYVAWEFSALGESSLPSVVLVNASIAGSRVQQLRSLRTGTQDLDDFMSFDNYTIRTRPQGRSRPKDTNVSSHLDKIHQSLEVVSDVDSYGEAPDSDSDDNEEGTDIVDSPDNALLTEATQEDNGVNEDDDTIEEDDSISSKGDDVFDWLVFGEDPNDLGDDDPMRKMTMAEVCSRSLLLHR